MKTFKQLREELNLHEDGEGALPANNTAVIPDKSVISKKVASTYKKKNASTAPKAGRKVLSLV